MAVWTFMGTSVTSSLQPHASSLDNGAPSHSLLAHEAGHGCRVATDGFRREILKALAYLRRADRLGYIGADLVDDIGRCLRGRRDGEPCRRGKPRQRLRDGRHLGQRRHAPFGGHAEQPQRSEEHTSELQSREKLVCRLLLEKKKTRS